MRITLFSILLLLVACGVPDDRFRVEGHFKNLNQGEFYLYSLEKGTCDTIRVNDGRFVYDVALHDTTTMVLMFPNFSELPIFAEPGALVKIEGDVSHLKETTVKGTDDNKAMTAFRLETNELTPPEVQQKAELFIGDHPSSPVSVYLLNRYFILNVDDDYPKAFDLCTTLLDNQPANLRLIQLHQRLERLKNLHRKGQLPPFRTVDTNGRNITNDDLNRKVNIIFTWASWSFESQTIIRQLNNLQKDYPKDLKVVSICIDASPAEGRQTLKRDSITWPNICDGKLWDTPIMAQLGLTFVPDNMIIDQHGNIIARSLSNNELREKAKQMLE